MPPNLDLIHSKCALLLGTFNGVIIKSIPFEVWKLSASSASYLTLISLHKAHFSNIGEPNVFVLEMPYETLGPDHQAAFGNYKWVISNRRNFSGIKN